jgi:sarcosine oxidase subunit gamma
MSEPAPALGGARAEGYVAVAELMPQGIISVRGDLSEEGEGVAQALADATGADLPGLRGMTHAGDKALAWMSPDEAMIFCSHDEAEELSQALREALTGAHALVANVSDARATFELSGAAVREVIAKLAPVDMERFAPGEIRRTRLAQIPAAFWMPEEGRLRLICFRSVARYAFDLLAKASETGAELHPR